MTKFLNNISMKINWAWWSAQEKMNKKIVQTVDKWWKSLRENVWKEGGKRCGKQCYGALGHLEQCKRLGFTRSFAKFFRRFARRKLCVIPLLDGSFTHFPHSILLLLHSILIESLKDYSL